jgi:hypothetical protein
MMSRENIFARTFSAQAAASVTLFFRAAPTQRAYSFPLPVRHSAAHCAAPFRIRPAFRLFLSRGLGTPQRPIGSEQPRFTTSHESFVGCLMTSQSAQLIAAYELSRKPFDVAVLVRHFVAFNFSQSFRGRGRVPSPAQVRCGGPTVSGESLLHRVAKLTSGRGRRSCDRISLSVALISRRLLGRLPFSRAEPVPAFAFSSVAWLPLCFSAARLRSRYIFPILTLRYSPFISPPLRHQLSSSEPLSPSLGRRAVRLYLLPVVPFSAALSVGSPDLGSPSLAPSNLGFVNLGSLSLVAHCRPSVYLGFVYPAALCLASLYLGSLYLGSLSALYRAALYIGSVYAAAFSLASLSLICASLIFVFVISLCLVSFSLVSVSSVVLSFVSASRFIFVMHFSPPVFASFNHTVARLTRLASSPPCPHAKPSLHT